MVSWCRNESGLSTLRCTWDSAEDEINKAIGELENRVSFLASQGLSAVSRTVRASEGHAEESVQDLTSRLLTLEKDTEGHHVWTMKKIQKLEDEGKAAVHGECHAGQKGFAERLR